MLCHVKWMKKPCYTNFQVPSFIRTKCAFLRSFTTSCMYSVCPTCSSVTLYFFFLVTNTNIYGIDVTVYR